MSEPLKLKQMKAISKYTKFVPYFYFLSVIVYWFTDLNKSEGISAYPILLFGIPFLWQLIKPNRKLNFSLGIIFVCLSSYLVLAYLSDLLNIINWSKSSKRFLFYGGLLVLGNFIMSLWIVRNSIKKVF
ncbi:hypothetical protein FBALC1_04772 [Flavobacteriales bacterium ALC-1]|nr:hypothetical protein FBALC1_04772 [Flavobacteriales bacterium ALC-1]